MNNLYRDLAPVTEEAWAEIESEATRTFKRHIAGRRVVDVSDPGGPVTAAVSTGHLLDVATPGDGVVAHLRESKPLVRLRVPFTLSRTDIDDVERGSQDSDWDPVKEAAKKLAFVEDRAIFEGYEAASIGGIRNCSSNPPLALPGDPREMPDVIAQALSELRLAGVDGPYSVLLSADVYTKVSETTEHGYPIREHLNRLVDGDIIWAPAIDGAFVLSTRVGVPEAHGLGAGQPDRPCCVDVVERAGECDDPHTCGHDGSLLTDQSSITIFASSDSAISATVWSATLSSTSSSNRLPCRTSDIPL
jgi:uncharacterized linocin/CFP29 family protein